MKNGSLFQRPIHSNGWHRLPLSTVLRTATVQPGVIFMVWGAAPILAKLIMVDLQILLNTLNTRTPSPTSAASQVDLMWILLYTHYNECGMLMEPSLGHLEWPSFDCSHGYVTATSLMWKVNLYKAGLSSVSVRSTVKLTASIQGVVGVVGGGPKHWKGWERNAC